MAQLDVFRSVRGGSAYPLLVDVQAAVHARLATCVVVPLVPRARAPKHPISGLTPLVKVGGEDYVLVTPMLASIARSGLGAHVGTLAAHRGEVIAALDLLLAGS